MPLDSNPPPLPTKKSYQKEKKFSSVEVQFAFLYNITVYYKIYTKW